MKFFASILVIQLIISCSLLGAVEDSSRQKIDTYLQGMKDSGYAYSVLVSRSGNILIQEAYGWADTSRKCRATVHTLFNVASITKSFTSIAIFQLQEEGKIAMEDPLSKFFKNAPKDKQSVTVQQLLLHTSGLQQKYAADGKQTRDQAVDAILSDTLSFKPGSDFSYSNENFELLAAIVEIAGSVSYEDYVRKHILEKADMKETKFWDEVDPRTGCSAASINRLGVPPARRNWGYIGSGGIYSTVTDLNRWFTALNTGRLLDSSHLQMMWEPRWKATSTQIASGWFVSQTEGTTEIWTRGAEDWGHNAVLRWFPEKKLLIIVETNSGEAADKNMTGNRLISDKLVELLK